MKYLREPAQQQFACTIRHYRFPHLYYQYRISVPTFTSETDFTRMLILFCLLLKETVVQTTVRSVQVSEIFRGTGKPHTFSSHTCCPWTTLRKKGPVEACYTSCQHMNTGQCLTNLIMTRERSASLTDSLP
jgi:hypothetical protein